MDYLKNKKILLVLAVSVATVLLSVIIVLILIKLNIINLPDGVDSDVEVQAEFESYEDALENEEYKNYPANPAPTRGEGPWAYSYISPLDGDLLELDTSAGGGYKCCEQPTYYILVDESDEIFWIEYYQAGFAERTDEFYGPFRLTD